MSNYKHGLTGTRTHQAWTNMKTRCTNENSEKFKNYGGRGISFKPKWADFENFLADMGECPPGLTLERKDNDGDYTPENCVWATPLTQARNKQSNIEWEGQRYTLKALAEAHGLKPQCLRMRLFTYGWPLDVALKTPTGEPRCH